MAERVVGLDIGRDRIRAVEVENPRKAKPTLVRAHEIVLPEGAVRSGEVRELHTVASALRRMWSAAGFTSKQVVLGVGNQRVLARDLSVPKMPIEDIRASLPFQVQDLLPVPVADAILDFYPVSEGMGDNGPVINGLLIAALKEAVNANVHAVQLAGLTPIEVDLIPFALSRLLAARGTSEVLVLVDIGGTTTSVVVTANGVPEFVRIIPTGGDEVTNTLASRLGLTGLQAEDLKRNTRLGGSAQAPDGRAASEALNEASYELLNSVRNTVNYYVNTKPQNRPSRIVLTGGGSQLAGLAEALAELTHTAVSIGDPFARVSVGKNLSRTGSSPAPVSLAVALGLAMGSAA